MLDYLFSQMDCVYLSDLRFLSAEEKRHLARKVLKIPEEAFSRRDWEEALTYLTGGGAEPDARRSKKKLVYLLGMDEEAWIKRRNDTDQEA